MGYPMAGYIDRVRLNYHLLKILQANTTYSSKDLITTPKHGEILATRPTEPSKTCIYIKENLTSSMSLTYLLWVEL